MTDKPAAKDFLIGKDKVCLESGGNHFMKELTRAHYHEYQSADVKADYQDVGRKRSRSVILREIVKKVKQNGGRFLKRAKDKPSSWCEVSEREEVNAVVGAFRNHKRNLNKKHRTPVRRQQTQPRVKPSPSGDSVWKEADQPDAIDRKRPPATNAVVSPVKQPNASAECSGIASPGLSQSAPIGKTVGRGQDKTVTPLVVMPTYRAMICMKKRKKSSQQLQDTNSRVSSGFAPPPLVRISSVGSDASQTSNEHTTQSQQQTDSGTGLHPIVRNMQAIATSGHAVSPHAITSDSSRMARPLPTPQPATSHSAVQPNQAAAAAVPHTQNQQREQHRIIPSSSGTLGTTGRFPQRSLLRAILGLTMMRQTPVKPKHHQIKKPSRRR